MARQTGMLNMRVKLYLCSFSLVSPESKRPLAGWSAPLVAPARRRWESSQCPSCFGSALPLPAKPTSAVACSPLLARHISLFSNGNWQVPPAVQANGNKQCASRGTVSSY
jgi:hypothetical protein